MDVCWNEAVAVFFICAVFIVFWLVRRSEKIGRGTYEE